MILRLLGPWPVDSLMLVALWSTSTDCYNNRAYWQQFLFVNQLSQNSMAAPECLVCNSGPEIARCKLQQKPYISYKIWKKKKWIKIQNAAKDYKLIWPTTFNSEMVEKKPGKRFTCWIWVLPIHDISSIITQSFRSAQKQSKTKSTSSKHILWEQYILYIPHGCCFLLFPLSPNPMLPWMHGLWKGPLHIK
jgi:hypothetical protein